jgi:hypothetical protein
VPVPQRELDRPPRAAADPSTPPAVTRLSVATSPVDWLSRSGDVRKYGGRRWFVPDRCDPTASGCCADPHRLRASKWQNNVDYLVLEIVDIIWTSRLCRAGALGSLNQAIFVKFLSTQCWFSHRVKRVRKENDMGRFFKNPRTLLSKRESPLDPYIDEFAQQLCEQGYSLRYARRRVQLVAALLVRLFS